MPKLFVKEFSEVKHGVGVEPGYNQPPIEITDASRLSDQFQADTVMVRIWSDVDCHYVVERAALSDGEDDPEAAPEDCPLSAGTLERLMCAPGDGLKIAVIAKTAPS